MLHNSKISIVAAIGKNRELGKDNKLLWHIGDDLKHFKEITSGRPVIMGRKTFGSIGRPLPNRTNIVITRNKQQVTGDKKYEGVTVVESLEEAIEVAKTHPNTYSSSGARSLGDSSQSSTSNNSNEVFIIGGGQIFSQALSITDRLYLTVVEATFDADTFFPEYSQFTKTISKDDRESDGYKYSFLVLEK